MSALRPAPIRDPAKAMLGACNGSLSLCGFDRLSWKGGGMCTRLWPHV